MIDRAAVTGFLDHMQAARSWTASTRNQRLACIRSFFTYAAAAEPALTIYLADLAAIPPAQRPGRGTGEVHDHGRGHGAARRPGPGHPARAARSVLHDPHV